MQPPLQQVLTLSVVLLKAYCLGANSVERFVNYQTWRLIPAEAFKEYRRAQQPLIQGFVEAPTVVAFALQIWLAAWLPLGINRWTVCVMIAASLTGALSTVIFQLPIHSTFDRSGYSPELMRKLLRTDWIRKIADFVRLVATADLLHQLLNAR